MGSRHARDIRSRARFPLFSRACVEKIGEPGDEASCIAFLGIHAFARHTLPNSWRAWVMLGDA